MPLSLLILCGKTLHSLCIPLESGTGIQNLKIDSAAHERLVRGLKVSEALQIECYGNWHVLQTVLPTPGPRRLDFTFITLISPGEGCPLLYALLHGEGPPGQ